MNYLYADDGAIIPAGDCVVTLRGKEHLVHHFLVTEKDQTHVFFEDGYVLDCDDWVLTIGAPIDHFVFNCTVVGFVDTIPSSKVQQFATLALNDSVSAKSVEQFLLKNGIHAKVRRNWIGHCEFGHSTSIDWASFTEYVQSLLSLNCTDEDLYHQLLNRMSSDELTKEIQYDIPYAEILKQLVC